MQYGDTALHKACSRGDHNTVDLLIKAGANVDIVNNVSLSYDNVYHFMYFSKKGTKYLTLYIIILIIKNS